MRRVARALAVFILFGLMFQLGLYVPANGSFPVDWLDMRISLGDGAAAFTGLPQQDRGAADRSHYKSPANRGERPQLPSRDKQRARQRPLVLPDGRVDISGAKRRADLSSATATTFELADGSFVRNVSPQRVNFKAADGT